MEEKVYKVGDKVPQAGRYQCAVCGVVIEFLQKHVDMGVMFQECPVCHAGSEGGPKKVEEDFWKLIG
jgi:cytochrome c2